MFHALMAPRPIAYTVFAVACVCALLALGRLCSGAPASVGTGWATRRGLEPHLVLDRQTARTVERLHSGDVVRPGDLVQVSYVAAGHRYGVVVSVDGRGAVTLHHPAVAHQASRIEARGEVPLDHAFELDDAPGFERFFFVAASAAPLDASLVLAAAHRLARDGLVASRQQPLPLPADVVQSSFLLRKTP